MLEKAPDDPVLPATANGATFAVVADVRVRYGFDGRWSAAAGVDNLSGGKYFLFHPFPQPTFQAELKYDYE